MACGDTQDGSVTVCPRVRLCGTFALGRDRRPMLLKSALTGYGRAQKAVSRVGIRKLVKL